MVLELALTLGLVLSLEIAHTKHMGKTVALALISVAEKVALVLALTLLVLVMVVGMLGVGLVGMD